MANVLQSLVVNEREKWAYIVIKTDDLRETNAVLADIDGLINFPRSIKGVEVAIQFRELKDGIKVSFRSWGDVDVSYVASAFEGGGHKRASGCFFTHRISSIGIGSSTI